MKSAINDKWTRAMDGIPTLEVLARELRAIASHLGLAYVRDVAADGVTPGWGAYLHALQRAEAMEALLAYLRSLPSLTAEPVAERFATDAQADKYGATHMLLMRVPGMEKVTRKSRAKAKGNPDA